MSDSIDRSVRQLPFAVGLCPDPDHMAEFSVHLDYADIETNNTICPECSTRLAIYTPRGYPDAEPPVSTGPFG